MNPCDLCGATDSLDTPGDPSKKIRICKSCGFVHVKERRSIAEVAQAWTDIYRSGGYDPNWPGVKARLFYVAEWLDQTIGLRGKSVLDIGAGNGRFMDYVADRGGNPCGIDPDSENVAEIARAGFNAVQAMASDHAKPPFHDHWDIVTLNWTLENTADCLAVLRYAKRCLAPGGHVVVSTGSRILVPFKKPLSSYLPQDVNYPHDTHCYRWSLNSIRCAISAAGMKTVNFNDCKDRDEMVVVGIQDVHPHCAIEDNPIVVEDHFLRWQTCSP